MFIITVVFIQKIIWSITDDDKRLRTLFTRTAAVENILSDGTDVPGIDKFIVMIFPHKITLGYL